MTTATPDFSALITPKADSPAFTPIVLAQASLPAAPASAQPASTVTQVQAPGAPASASAPSAPTGAATAQAGAGQVITAGATGFEANIDFSQVRSVNVVDTDLLLILNDGQRIVLRDGALRAAIQPGFEVKLGNQALTAGELFKRVGQIKPVEGGSFRLQATEIKPQPSDPANGNDVNMGATEAQAIAQEISQAAKVLERLAQAAQSSRMSNAADATPGMPPAPPPAPVNQNTSLQKSVSESASSGKTGTGGTGNPGAGTSTDTAAGNGSSTETGAGKGTSTDTGAGAGPAQAQAPAPAPGKPAETTPLSLKSSAFWPPTPPSCPTSNWSAVPLTFSLTTFLHPT
jgi:hypothetical protein